MPSIPNESIPHYENAIYLPMLIKILEKDLLTIEVSQIKLKRPYTKIIDQAIKNVQTESKKSHIYLKRNNMQLVKKGTDKEFTEYAFYNGGYEDHRRYSNIRLRNRTEELMNEYFAMIDIVSN